jgi:hypothetical protein
MNYFEISLQSVSESAKFNRSQDTAALEKFNADIKKWANDTSAELRASVRSKVKRDVVLSASIVPKFGYDRKYGREVNRVGFSFLREGVYIHKGAGRGYGGTVGSKWRTLKGELKRTNPGSLGKMGTGNRRPVEWFNPVIERELTVLADIVSNYSADLQLNATKIYIE